MLAKKLNDENEECNAEEVKVKTPFDLGYLRNSMDGMFEEEIRPFSMQNIFWHCIYYFTIKELPYDFILPSEDIDILSQYVNSNKHINVCTDNPEEIDE